VFDALSKAFFKMIGMVMKLAPIGTGSAMAFTVGKYGVHSLAPLLKLMGSFYLTCLLFVLIVLGLVARSVRVRLRCWRVSRQRRGPFEHGVPVVRFTNHRNNHQ
jgi:Na+/H+-dicarboxylate symporter